MDCYNCKREVPEHITVCPFCGADLTVQPKADNSKAKKILPFIITAVVCLAVGIGVAFAFTSRDKAIDKPETTVSSQQDEAAEEAAAEKTEPTVTETTVVTTKAPTTTVTTTQAPSTSAVTPDKLYRPEKSKFCDQYEMYISGNFEGQEYAKMRFGPSKYDYNVVGQIDNGSVVTVQTQSVNGWTLIYYEGKEGWVRTDFLFNTYDECFNKTPAQSSTPAQNGGSVVLPDEESCVSYAGVDVTGQYDGEPLNMRSGPSRDYDLITTVPDGATIEVWGYSNKTSEWIYVKYNGYYVWGLSKYVYLDGVGDKPVLYLYPEKETDVDVKVSLNNMYFTCTYPEYGNGWSVTAKPDGTLINKKDNKEYSYLYWELGGKQNYDFSKGFVVKGSDTAEFLQEALSEMGLTPREYNEFIVYWLPKMQNNEYNLISFQKEEYTDNVRLDISPKPDSTLRVFMAYKALDEEIEIEPQEFEPFERKGFTVVEWGGAQVQ
ncbi:MAG: SH3 domain-containing protein [Acutalibacteraceae bacterium]